MTDRHVNVSIVEDNERSISSQFQRHLLHSLRTPLGQLSTHVTQRKWKGTEASEWDDAV